jgi:hypothetical protein
VPVQFVEIASARVRSFRRADESTEARPDSYGRRARAMRAKQSRIGAATFFSSSIDA